MTTQARHVRWFLAFLVALFAAVVGLFSAAPASGAPAAYTYDTTPDGYDALADSSTAHASFGAARGSPAGSEVISWASHVSTGRLGVAANTGDALLSTASSGAGRSLPMNMETVCGMACKFGRLGALASAGATETISHDPIGSPVDLIKSTGAIARSYDYAPFGTPRTPVGAPTTPSGPTTSIGYGRLLTTADMSTLAGRDRGYLPALGRWTGTDPLGVQTANAFDAPYTYVDNAANSYIDTLGQSLCDGVFNICDTGKYLLAEDLGAEAAMERLVWSAMDPADTIDQAVKGCQAAATANGGGAYGVMACADTLNPFAAIRDGFAKAVTSPCLEESGKALGGSLFNVALIASPATSEGTLGLSQINVGAASEAAANTGTARFIASSDGFVTDLVGSRNAISIGHDPEYVANAQATGARTFSMADDAWNAMSPTEQWVRNQRFLDDAISRGREIQLATPLSQVRAGSFLEREIGYLSGRGYVPNFSGTLMIPGGG